ncbi:MAG: GtrA family protein [bacterium]|nr:GtrA family protein [bacterium]
MQLAIYFVIGSLSALFNLGFFWGLDHFTELSLAAAAGSAYFLASLVNYWLSIQILFKHQARWSSGLEFFIYLGVVLVGGFLDVAATSWLIQLGATSLVAKACASFILFLINFVMRKLIVFPQKPIQRF